MILFKALTVVIIALALAACVISTQEVAETEEEAV